MTEKIYWKTASAPVNIATLKYWGKRDVNLNLPTNSSISVTLSQEDLCALTTASCSPDFEQDELWLNGKKENIEDSSRTIACLKELRNLRKEFEKKNPSLPSLSNYKLKIISENNFPTAAGLASSAAGFAALVRAIADLYELPQTSTELSKIARQGSGSACRSIFGGYVAWEMGKKNDGSDSQAVLIAPKSHWPNMRAAILVVSSAKKSVSSTSGMQVTVKTSTLFKYRVEEVVPSRFNLMSKAIKDKDFNNFAKLTMADSNQFHAVCLDSSPPIFYLNDTSRAIILAVEELNKVFKRPVAAYTYDAGPNAVLYYLDEDEHIVLGFLKKIIPNVDGWDVKHNFKTADLPDEYDNRYLNSIQEGVSKVIFTSVGDDPKSNISKNLLSTVYNI